MFNKLIFLGLLCFSWLAHAADGYELISPAKPVQNTDKIEVIEFFWYGCPHCYHLEPAVVEWLKTKPANVEFIRQPAVFSEQWGKNAKAFYTAEALGILDKVHEDLFNTLQIDKNSLNTEEQLAKFFADHGVKAEDFHNAYNSFGVYTKLRQAEGMGPRYGINGVPTIIVNGKYRVTGSSAKSQENMLNVVNQIIQSESKGN